MAELSEPAASSGQAVALQRVAALLGGARILRRTLKNPLDAHEMLLEGLPGRALAYLVDGFLIIRPTVSFEKAVGMSLRTFQRRKGAPTRPLSPEQSGRTWKFAEILRPCDCSAGVAGRS